MTKGRDKANPFVLNNNVCELKCDVNYWNPWDYAETKPASPNEQMCVSKNCKAFDYHDNTKQPEECSICWNNADIQSSNFPVKLTYRPNMMKGR